MADDEKTIDHAEGDRRNREEIHRRNRFAMITQKCEPSFRCFGISRRSFHPTGNRSLEMLKAEHEKSRHGCAARPRSGFSCNHPEDQLPNFLRDLFPPKHAACFGDRAPIEGESCSVPPDHRVRVSRRSRACIQLDHNLRASNPEKFVKHPKPWPRMLTLQSCELLPKNEVFKQEAAMRAEEAEN